MGELTLLFESSLSVICLLFCIYVFTIKAIGYIKNY